MGLPPLKVVLVVGVPPPHLVSAAGSVQCLESQSPCWHHLKALLPKDLGGNLKLKFPHSTVFKVAPPLFLRRVERTALPPLPASPPGTRSGAWPR